MLQRKELEQNFIKLQNIYGENTLMPIYGTGCIDFPDVCFVFMNPTARNLGTHPNWEGLRAPWLGISPVWKMIYELGYISQKNLNLIQNNKNIWTPEFVENLYQEISGNKGYITNLSKASQKDAKPLKNSAFIAYRDLFFQEVNSVNPKKIISFGGQVSSIILGKNIKISDHRKKKYSIDIKGNQYDIYPVYYPVGLGMRNMGKAIEDLQYILQK